MTEEEAKTKVCHRTLAALAVQEVGSFHQHAYCIASACMAWRTQPSLMSVGRDGEIYTVPHSSNGGFCGLAGAQR